MCSKTQAVTEQLAGFCRTRADLLDTESFIFKMAAVLAPSAMHSTLHSTQHDLHEEMLLQIQHHHRHHHHHHHQDNTSSSSSSSSRQHTTLLVRQNTRKLLQCRSRNVKTEPWGQSVKVILVGLEPTIPGSVGRCLIHWATGPVLDRSRKHVIFQFATVLPGCQVIRTLRALPSCCNFNTDCLESRG